MTNDYIFHSLKADRENNDFQNIELLPKVLSLFEKYKYNLTDDTYPSDPVELINYVISDINETAPHFYAITTLEGDFMGVVWLRLWHGTEDKMHSVQIQSYMCKEYWGYHTKQCLIGLMRTLFDDYGLERIQMEIPDYNHKAQSFALKMGFKLEGRLRHASVKNGKNVSHSMYSILVNEFRNKYEGA